MGSHHILLVLLLMVGCDPSAQDNWFDAAAYIVTQDGLDEAPYRYAKFLDEALEKLQNEDFPLISNGNPCDFRHRIGPTVERSKLQLIKNSIKVQTYSQFPSRVDY